ncbi:MAG TPA: MmgE/PrpD family protein [Xanthobacteraceae bacterium]|nr:MmgE/PrpD family protein [Xanthobacteraceae bacterium]
MNELLQLAEILQARAGALDARILEKLRLHVADTVAAWIASAQTAEGRALIAFRDRMKRRSAGRDVALDVATNCALVRLSEIDDIHLRSMTTPGSIAISAAITLATQLPNVDGGDVVPAMLAGYEAMTRLGLAIDGPKVLYRGIWPTYFGAGFAAAAVAARLLRLSPAQTAQALALALTMAAPSVGQHHAATTARWFLVGNAARNGLTAAFAAQSGFSADLEILRSRLFPEVYGIEPDITAIADSALVFPEVSLKPWCAARQTMAATQGLREILHAGVRASDVSQITAYVLPPHLRMIDHGVTAGDRASYLTSLPYQLSLAASQPEGGSDLAAAAPPPSIHAFMARIKVVAEEALLADYPSRWPARIVVETASTRHERQIDCIPGDPARPLTEADIQAKFRRFTAAAIGRADEKVLHLSLTAPHSPQSLALLMREIDHVMVRAMT